MSIRAEAEKIFQKRYAHLKLSEKRADSLMDVIVTALKTKNDYKTLVKRWAERKGVDLEVKEKSNIVVAEGGIQVKNLDRKSLKATVLDLRDAGVKIKYDKEDTDQELVAKISLGLAKLPSPEMMAKLGRIDPNKLALIHGPDGCIGLFVDMKQAECLVCPDNNECIKKYINNLSGNFKQFRDAMIEARVEQDAQSVTEEEVEAVAKKKSKEEPKKKSRRIRYDKEMEIYVMDIENPENKKKNPEVHACIQDILDNTPKTLGALKKLVYEHFEYDTPRKFMEEFFAQMRNEGVVLLWDDLSKKQRKQFKEDSSEEDDDDDNEDEEEDDDDDE